MMPSSIGSMFRASVKSARSDELVNTYLQRPLAALVTYVLAFTPVTPNQVTLMSTLFGFAGAILLALEPPMLAVAGVCFYLKDLFDSADGQLARATGRFSRRGRFWDSIGDFTVNCALFTGMFLWLTHQGAPWAAAGALSLAAWLGVNLRVSYQVFYQTSYLHEQGSYRLNRVTEEVRAEDTAHTDPVTLRLQRIFQVMYGWQDRLMAALDRQSRHRAGDPDRARWYADRAGLRLTSLFGMGTEFVALALCLLAGQPGLYLALSLGAFNVLWACAVVYRLFFALRTSASIAN